MSADPPRGPSVFPRALAIAFGLALLLTLVSAYLVVTGPGNKGLLILIVPFVIAAFFLALLLPCWLFLNRAARLRDSTRPGLVQVQMAGSVLLGIAAVYPILAFVAPHTFLPRKPYVPLVKHAPEADFTAPWGGRMIALDIVAVPALNRRAQRLWVAETELTRGENARILGTREGPEDGFPLTALSRTQLDSLLAAMNAAPRPPATPPGRFRLPEHGEAMAYAESRTIVDYVRCESQVRAVGELSPDEFGLRGVLDNASEIVVVPTWAGPPLCAMPGGVEPFCGGKGPSATRGTRIAACDDRDADIMWKHPAVGMRVVYSSP